MEDNKIIELFWQRDDLAIEETKKKFGRLCFQIGKNITGSVEDAEEVENETYLRLWNIIPPEKPDFLKSFICRIAKNISIDRVRYNQANKRKYDEVIPMEEVADVLSGNETPENLYEQKETSGYISDFLRLQKTEARRIFIQRYWYCFSISEIAKAFGVSENKVKVTLHRVRKDLKKYLEAKGVVL